MAMEQRLQSGNVLEENVDSGPKMLMPPTKAAATKGSMVPPIPSGLESRTHGGGKENVSTVFVERGAVVTAVTPPEKEIQDSSLCENAAVNVENPASEAAIQKQGSGEDQNLKPLPPHVVAIMFMREKKQQQQQLQQQKQLPAKERSSKGEGMMKVLPPHIKVPAKNAFRYPERYRSPTDALVSPVSRGLLTRNRRPARTLAPVGPPKALESTFEEEANVDAAVDTHPVN